MNAQISVVYGPVRSWRLGWSLGVDPIGETSTCSFNCIYCQLGEIQNVTAERRVYVSTERLARDLDAVDWSGVDVVTFSGSGEPTLAANLDEMVREVRRRAERPIHILTNATLFHLPEVRRVVAEIDVVSCKLDAASDAMLQRINRPAPGISIESIVSGIEALKRDYRGRIELQIMFMPMNVGEVEALIPLIRRIEPAAVQLNTPRRPYPMEWHIETRGAHDRIEFDWPTRRLATIDPQAARAVEARLSEATGVPVRSIYRASGETQNQAGEH